MACANRTTTMAPAAVPALAQSESKTRFFQRLSLRDDSKGDKDLYAAMKVIYPGDHWHAFP